MSAVSVTTPTISHEFVARLAERAQEAEKLRRLPPATIDDLNASRFTGLLLPVRYGGSQADFPAILDPVRRMAHGCASSAWTIGFYALHNWVLALFDERAQDEAFATRPFLAPAPLAPTGRGVPTNDGVRLTGRWSWATGVMHGKLDHRRRIVRTRGRPGRHLPRPCLVARSRHSDRGCLAHGRNARHRLQ
jgi:alkylation response protein AidB-like acyl-CoA dehydrogenase